VITHDRLSTIAAFLIDAERLKRVDRKAYVSDFSRRENSAEHSWHLSLGLLTLARELNLEIDLPKALMMAVIHDLCEIDAGDTPAYGPARADQHAAERKCIERFAGYGLRFGGELQALWLEYEEQQTRESRWVKVLDRLMPFIVNLATGGRNWREQSVSRSQVLKVNEPVRQHAPEVFAWMVGRVDEAVHEGWLLNA
jgi:putative hydrolases of HD superfamily